MSVECSAGNIPPGYKQTEVGVIPEDWYPVTIGDIAIKVGSGITPRGGSSNYKEYGRPFVRSQNVGWGTLLLTDLVYIDDNTHKSFSSTELRQEDVLLNITGASIGRSAIADARLAGGNVNQHVCIIRTEATEVDSRFLNFVLLSAQGQRQIDSFQAGGNREGLNFGQIRSIILPLPSTLAEQEAIAEALSDTDAFIESLEQLIIKKHQIKQGAMQELLTGKKRLPGFSEEWETKRLGDVADMGSGGTPPSSVSSYYDGEISWVSISDMTKGGKVILSTDRNLSQKGFANSAAQMFPSGTVLYAMYASIGECSIAGISLCSSQAILGIRPKEKLSNEFLYYYLISLKNDVKSMGQQGTQANLNKGMVQSFKFHLPPLPEQTAIATILSDMDAEISTLEEKLTKARQLKQGMMQELLTGRIRLI